MVLIYLDELCEAASRLVVRDLIVGALDFLVIQFGLDEFIVDQMSISYENTTYDKFLNGFLLDIGFITDFLSYF